MRDLDHTHAFARRVEYSNLTGREIHPAISIYHEFKYHPKEVITGTQDWIYEHLGALFWTVEIWAPNRPGESA